VMEQTVQGGAVLLEGVRTFLAGTDPKPVDTPSIESSLRAMRRYEQVAKALPPAPQGSFAVGTSNLQRRIRDELGLDYTLGETEALAVSEVERVVSCSNPFARDLEAIIRRSKLFPRLERRGARTGRFLNFIATKRSELHGVFARRTP
jgi:hypothetical protein